MSSVKHYSICNLSQEKSSLVFTVPLKRATLFVRFVKLKTKTAPITDLTFDGALFVGALASIITVDTNKWRSTTRILLAIIYL